MYFLFSHVLLPHTELANSILKTLYSYSHFSSIYSSSSGTCPSIFIISFTFGSISAKVGGEASMCACQIHATMLKNYKYYN